MKNKDNPKQPIQPTKQSKQTQKQFPFCINKKQAKLVCLNSKCNDYAFFCTQCPDDQCEIIHQHGDKLQSVSFKQYIKRVLKDKKIDENLQKAINSYVKGLQKLKKDVQLFVEVELKQIEEIKKKALEVSPDDEKIIKKLRQHNYQAIKGLELDQVWKNTVGLQQQNEERNKQAIQFLNMKEEQVRQISENFENVNQMEIGQNQSDGEQDIKDIEDIKDNKDNQKEKNKGNQKEKEKEKDEKKEQQNDKAQIKDNKKQNNTSKINNPIQKQKDSLPIPK